jgi:AcrR family transcriptional regulator
MNSSKDRILDAAERIIVRDGVSHLTLDAVAAETAMSKGGVLYHFRSKDDLIRGMIARLMEQYEADVTRLEAEDPSPTGRRLRSMLRVSFSDQEQENRCDQVAASLLAAVVTNPLLLEPVHDRMRALHAAIVQDARDPLLAMVIHLAADGIWMGKLFRSPAVDPELNKQVVDRLIEMTKIV